MTKYYDIKKRMKNSAWTLPGPAHLVEDRMHRLGISLSYRADRKLPSQYLSEYRSRFTIIRPGMKVEIPVKTVEAFTRSPEELEWKNR